MNRNVKIGLIAVAVIAFLGLMLFLRGGARDHYTPIPENTIGNTAGNLRGDGMFCEYGGIESDIISGNSTDPEDTDIYTWNKVKIDGTYYNIDVWSDDINGITPLNFHRYFCRSDGYMARTSDSPYPADDDTLNFYDVNGLVVTDTKSFYELFNERAKWAVSNGSNNFELAFSSKALLENTVENKELLLDAVYRFNQDLGELTKKYDFRNYEEEGLCVLFYI